ncbi:hypothetical protein PFISCL1PPCAC_27987, partial [Pristionchus fissidentatus]
PVRQTIVMRLRTLLLVSLLLIEESLNCPDDNYSHIKGKPENKFDGKCTSNLTIEDKNEFVQPFYYDQSVRFNQLQRLHLLGGSVICAEEINHAFIRLLYLYASIFPAIKANRPDGEKERDPEWIVFQDVSKLDSRMQVMGRQYLHRHGKDQELELNGFLRKFVRDLNETNWKGFGGKFKLYRSYCSNTPAKRQHADAMKLGVQEAQDQQKLEGEL